MSKVETLHKKWSREADYRAAYDELEPEFGTGSRADRGPCQCRADAGATCQAHEDHTIGSSAARRRACPSVHQDAGKNRTGHWHAPQNQL